MSQQTSTINETATHRSSPSFHPNFRWQQVSDSPNCPEAKGDSSTSWNTNQRYAVDGANSDDI
jgi:hypothetical protein